MFIVLFLMLSHYRQVMPLLTELTRALGEAVFWHSRVGVYQQHNVPDTHVPSSKELVVKLPARELQRLLPTSTTHNTNYVTKHS